MTRFVDPLARGRYRDPFIAIRRSYACFDRLPAPVREVLRDSPRNWSPYKARAILSNFRALGNTEKVAITRTIARIRDRDERAARTQVSPHAPVAGK